jgi:hypothetical protein
VTPQNVTAEREREREREAGVRMDSLLEIKRDSHPLDRQKRIL